MSILLRRCRCVTFSPESLQAGDLRIEGDAISERGAALRPRRGEEIVDCHERLVLPGLVCAHTHLYSSLARGMPGPSVRPLNFLEILDKVWWKLDRALDENAIYYSALVGVVEAVRCGTTSIIDHHASPEAISGSLDIIKEACEKVGIRALLCYEVTDRGGRKERDAGLRENERFIRANRRHGRIRGMVGAHAPFTLSNASLRMCAEIAAREKTGVHIHVAEDRSDIVDAAENYRCGVADRLADQGLLTEDTILVHGVHLTPADLSRIRRARSWIVHNPRSNMNNRVGYAPLHLFGDRVGLGTDGFPADMFEESRYAFFSGQENGARFQSTDTSRLLCGSQEIVSSIFRKKVGPLVKGAAADLVILNYAPPTPLTPENLLGHLLFGMTSSMVESVMIGGKWVVKDREVVGIDIAENYRKAAESAKRLWARMARRGP